MPFRLRYGALLAIVLLGATSALAQKADARIRGLVADKKTGNPVRGGEVIYAGDSRSAPIDSAGRFVLTDLPSGIVRIYVRGRGYPVMTFAVALARGEDLERRFDVDSAGGASRSNAQALPKVAVTAEQPLGPRFADFERRRITGRGQYRTAEQIEKGNYMNLQDIVRDMRGVNVDCGGGAGCFIRMSRAPMQCLPQYIVDDRPDPDFGPGIAVRDIQGLEVYTGPTDTPGEYAGVNAGCGTIVIWTRSSPLRHKP